MTENGFCHEVDKCYALFAAYLDPEDERLLDEESTTFGDQKR